MDTQLTQRGMRSCIAALVILTFVPWAAAALITPGQTIYAVSEPDPSGGTILATSGPVPFASATFSGTLTSTVIFGDTNNPWGGLTFTYLLADDPGSATEIGRLTTNGFAGFQTDVSYQLGNGVAPALTDRSIGLGDVVGFSFLGAPVGPGNLLPGQFSELMVVQTASSTFAQSFSSVIDGGVVSVPSFAPVPEPATLALLSLGGLALIRRRR